jgi:hypothetical protein
MNALQTSAASCNLPCCSRAIASSGLDACVAAEIGKSSAMAIMPELHRFILATGSGIGCRLSIISQLVLPVKAGAKMP